MVSKQQKKDSYKQAKQRVPVFQGNSVVAQMLRILFFGTSKTK